MSSVCDRDLMGLAKMGLASRTKATMTYLFPWLDVTGNQPVWLVVMWPVTSMHFTFTRFVRNCGIWEDSTFVVTVDVEGEEGDGLVLRTFLRTSLRWPLAVDIDLGRYFRIRELVRPGRVAKKELSMAIVQMWMTGHHAQRRIHVARSTLVRRLYTFTNLDVFQRPITRHLCIFFLVYFTCLPILNFDNHCTSLPSHTPNAALIICILSRAHCACIIMSYL